MKKPKSGTVQKSKYKTPFWKTVRKNWMLLFMLLPALLYVIVFSYIPMSGLVLAFKRYQYAGGIYGSPWVGLDNFKALMVAGKLGQSNAEHATVQYCFYFSGRGL